MRRVLACSGPDLAKGHRMNPLLAPFKPPIIAQTPDTSSTEGLAKAVAELSHRAAIGELSSMYAFAADDRDMDTMLSLFTTDAVFDQNGTEYRGQERIREFITEGLGGFTLTVHVATSHVVWFGDAGEAFGISVGHGDLVQDGQMIRCSYRYRDRYRLTDNRWQFAYRAITTTYMLPLQQYGQGDQG